MDRERKCMEKDKRLLVLLAFGALILLSDFSTDIIPALRTNEPYWLEIQQEGDVRVYRLSEPEDLLMVRESDQAANILSTLKRNKVAAIGKDKDNAVIPVRLSPRLSFLFGQPMSVNTATAGELSLLSGIGPSLAQNIVQYREKHGIFNSRKDLVAVPGIGEKRAENMLQGITFAE